MSSTQFKTEITCIRVLKKLTIVASKEEINVCSYNERFKVIEILIKLPIDNKSNNCFDIWSNKSNIRYFIAYVIKSTEISIIAIYENCLEVDEVTTIETGFENKGQASIQNTFYDEKTDYLFVVDGNGSYIRGFSLIDSSKRCELYRGLKYAYVSSIVSVSKNHIAVASSSKTIHIFDLNNSEKQKSYFGAFYNFLWNPYSLNKSILKISLEEDSKEDEIFFDLEFRKKGCLLISDETKDNIYLTCLSYNGFFYKYSLNLQNLNSQMPESKLLKKFNWCAEDANINIKTSVNLTSEDSLDLIGVNMSKIEPTDVEKWKII